MNKPTLVIMAAGMGSRYGGLKQIDPITKDGHIIMDFSIYDAHKAGFSDVIFIIKEELFQTFDETIGKRAKKLMNVNYVFQSKDKFTENIDVSMREKPFGTGHAVLCTKEILKSSFAVINADDFYGYTAFKKIYDFLVENDKENNFALIGYNIENTLTENGFVSRGVCQTDSCDNLTSIVERTQIEIIDNLPAYTEDGGKTYEKIATGTPVSMNLWGFSNSFLNALEEKFKIFLENEYPKNKEKSEFFLPFVVDELIKAEKAYVKVIKTPDKWYGVTYKDDKKVIEHEVSKMINSGLYNGI